LFCSISSIGSSYAKDAGHFRPGKSNKKLSIFGLELYTEVHWIEDLSSRRFEGKLDRVDAIYPPDCQRCQSGGLHTKRNWCVVIGNIRHPQGIEALSEVFKSTPFRTSKQSQQLLRYIVDQTLAGHAEHLKERVIGAEVFGRPPDYDTNDDPIVRARAAEVRKRLAQYYVGEGSSCSVRIEINPGAYHASFSDSSRSAAKESGISPPDPIHRPEPNVVPELITSSSVTGLRSDRRFDLHLRASRYLALAALLVLLATVAFVLHSRGNVEKFWSPLLATSKPILIYTGANPVYMPSPALIQRYKATHHLNDLDTQGHEFLIPVSEDQKLGPGDLLELKNAFVTLGDVSANVNVASLLTKFNRSFDLRSGEDVAFGDLRQSPAVLIGAFNNGWTLQMTGDLPFVFGSSLTITDRSNPSRQWRPVMSAEGNIQFDYALVARLPHSKTGEPLITIAGITQCGTRAAAEFITSAQALSDLLRGSPKDWTSKNMEFVLQTKVVNDIPTNTTVAAIRYW